MNDVDSSENLTYSTIDADVPLTVSRYFGGDEEEEEGEGEVDPEGENGGDTEGGDESTEGGDAVGGGDETRSDSEGDEVVNLADLYTSFPAFSTMTFNYKITSTITSATIKSVTMIGENSDRFILTRHETDPWRFSVTTTAFNTADDTITGTVYVTANNVKGGLSYNVMQLGASSRPTARYITITPELTTKSSDTVDWNQYGDGYEQTFIATVNNGAQSELVELYLIDDEGNFETTDTDITNGLITVRATNENKSGSILTATLYAALDENSELTKGEFIFANATISQLTYVDPLTPPTFEFTNSELLEFPLGYQEGDTGVRQFKLDPGEYNVSLEDIFYDTNEGYTIEFAKTSTANLYEAIITVTEIGAQYNHTVNSDAYLYVSYVDENGDDRVAKSADPINIKFHVNQ